MAQKTLYAPVLDAYAGRMPVIIRIRSPQSSVYQSRDAICTDSLVARGNFLTYDLLHVVAKLNLMFRP